MPSSTTIQRLQLLVIALYVVVTAAIPYLYGSYVAPLLAAALLAMFAQRRISGIAVPWTVLLVGLGVLGAAIGFAQGNEGTRPTLTIFVIEPLVLGLLIGSVSRLVDWERWTTWMLDAALVAAVGLGLLLYVVSTADLTLPGWLVDPALNYVDTTGTTLRTNYQGFNALVFLAPYGIARYVWRRPEDSRWWALAMFALAIAGVVMAGRRVLYLTVPALAVAIVAMLVVRWWTQSDRRVDLRRAGLDALWGIVATAVVIIVVGVASGVGPASVLERSFAQVTLQETSAAEADPEGNDPRTEAQADPSMGVRELQSQELIEEWSESPVWGKGSGAVPDDYVRDPGSPWSFELTYHVILFNFGLLGAAVLGLWAAWITVWLLRAMWRRNALAATVGAGFAGTALASALDPYVFKLDGMWMVFIPFGVAVAAASRTWPRADGAPTVSTHPDRPELVSFPPAETASPAGASAAGSGSVLVGLVAYDNHAQVQEFVDALRAHDPGVRISVCDNSAEPPAGAGDLRGIDAHVARPDNPGYLDGGIAAFDAFTRRFPDEQVDWAILSNTDLGLVGEDLTTVLAGHDSTRPLVIAPRVTEGEELVEKNPHLPTSRSRFRLWVNHLVTGTPVGAYAFLVLAALRFKKQGSRRSGDAAVAPAGTTMYAPYGAVMVFSRGFLREVGLPAGVPLLAEEFAVAEAAEAGAAPVVFEPRIHVTHDPHSTTGPKVGYGRAKMLSTAFAWIHRTAEAR